MWRYFVELTLSAEVEPLIWWKPFIVMLFSKTLITQSKNAFCCLTATRQDSKIILLRLTKTSVRFRLAKASTARVILSSMTSDLRFDRTISACRCFLLSVATSWLLVMLYSCSSHITSCLRIRWRRSLYFSFEMWVLQAFLNYVNRCFLRWVIITFISFALCCSRLTQSFHHLKREAVVSE